MRYFGSVKFFKHMILTLLATLIIVPIVFASILLFKSNKLSLELNTVRAAAERDDNLTEINKDDMNQPKVQEENMSSVVERESISYQLDYPNLYAKPVKKVSNKDEKVIYLTFDDGPSKNTPLVLDILDKYKIKATFFVVYKNDAFSNSMYKAIVDRGHTIAVHTASHDYKKIYASVDSYLADFNKMYNHIYEQTGVKVDMFRFPGGSINAYNDGNYEEIAAEMFRRGFTYHDWNVSSGDASTKATENSIYHAVVDNSLKRNKSVVLMHDSSDKSKTVNALPKIIEALIGEGYACNKLDPSISPFLFSYKTNL